MRIWLIEFENHLCSFRHIDQEKHQDTANAAYAEFRAGYPKNMTLVEILETWEVKKPSLSFDLLPKDKKEFSVA